MVDSEESDISNDDSDSDDADFKLYIKMDLLKEGVRCVTESLSFLIRTSNSYHECFAIRTDDFGMEFDYFEFQVMIKKRPVRDLVL
jgi:hypothetical protein